MAIPRFSPGRFGIYSKHQLILAWLGMRFSYAADALRLTVLFLAETLFGSTSMGGGSHPVFHTHSSRRFARTTYSSHPSPYRQESTHDNDTFRSSRPNDDPLLQIPHR